MSEFGPKYDGDLMTVFKKKHAFVCSDERHRGVMCALKGPHTDRECECPRCTMGIKRHSKRAIEIAERTISNFEVQAINLIGLRLGFVDAAKEVTKAEDIEHRMAKQHYKEPNIKVLCTCPGACNHTNVCEGCGAKLYGGPLRKVKNCSECRIRT